MLIDILLLVPLLLAAVIAAAAIRELRGKLARCMGAANWSFNGSWASNVTIVGGLISFAAAAAVIPQNPAGVQLSLTHDQYVAFSVFFPLLVALAPLVYTCTGTVAFGPLPGGVQGVGVHGWGWTFLAAASFTVWGALGEAALQVLLVQDICAVAHIRQAAACVLGAFLGLLGLGVGIYALRSIVETVKAQSDPGVAPAAAAPQPRWALI